MFKTTVAGKPTIYHSTCVYLNISWWGHHPEFYKISELIDICELNHNICVLSRSAGSNVISIVLSNNICSLSSVVCISACFSLCPSLSPSSWWGEWGARPAGRPTRGPINLSSLPPGSSTTWPTVWGQMNPSSLCCLLSSPPGSRTLRGTPRPGTTSHSS